MAKNQHKNRHLGFTLIELLVVITIIGIMSSLLVLSVKSTDKQRSIETWSSRLNDQISYALDAAVLSNKNFAIQFNKQQARFLIRKKQEWVVYDKEPLKLIKFPEDSSTSLYIGEAIVSLEDEFKALAPNVLIDSLAIMTPFELHLDHLDETHIIKYDAAGKASHEAR